MPIPGLSGIMAGLRTMPVISYIGTPTPDTTNASAYTFAGASIGAASVDRLVVVAATLDSPSANSEIDTITIDGNGMTIHAESPSGIGVNQIAIASLLVAAGTTADIVVNLSNNSRCCSVHVFTITGLFSTTPTDTLINVGGSSDPTGTIDVEDKGILIAAAVSAAGTTCSWTGVTEDYDNAPETGTHTVGHESYAAVQSGLTVTANFGTNSTSRMVAVAFQ